jgi:hypothetical protein
MSSRLICRGLAPLLLLLAPAVLPAQADAPVTPADMMRHIEILASDAFEGRKPGTAGEARTTAYIVEQLRARGLEGAGVDGGWYQPVALVERASRDHRIAWRANERPLPLDRDAFVLLGQGER